MDYFLRGAAAAVGERGGEPLRRHHRSGLPPAEDRAGERLSPRLSRRSPASAAAIPCCPSSAWCPLAAMGRDARAFLHDAAARWRRLAVPRRQPADNPGVALGLAIGVLADGGRDKLTLIASRSIAPFGAWVEQLVAESTGKNGSGVIPIADEPLGEPADYGNDRLFVYLRDSAHPDPAQDARRRALEEAGHPVVRIGGGFAATPGAGILPFRDGDRRGRRGPRHQPFDQPDVEASKIATRAMTDAFEKRLAAAEPPVFEDNGIALYTDARNARRAAASWRGIDARRAGSRRTSRGPPAAIILRCSPISTPTTRSCEPCKILRAAYATASVSRPACNSGRASCTRPARPIKAGRIAACFFRLRRSRPPI